MELSDVFLGLGEEAFGQLLKSISIGKLKTYQLYDRMKARFHLAKLNSETIRKAAPRFLERLTAKDQELATDLAQSILVSHLDMIRAILDFLGIPHEEGFFVKDLEAAKYLTEGWQQRVYDKFRDVYSPALLLFYINHLGLEVEKAETFFAPAA